MTATRYTGCPFCGGQFRVVVPAEGSPMLPHVMHTMPPCAEFEKKDALEYTIAARRALGAPAAPEDAN